MAAVHENQCTVNSNIARDDRAIASIEADMTTVQAAWMRRVRVATVSLASDSGRHPKLPW